MALVQTHRIPLEDITVDITIYPRAQRVWFTSYKYFRMLRAGSVFPPITVTKIKDHIVLVDGFHRLEAHRMNKETAVECEIIECASMNEAYVETVRRNVAHGLPLSTYEILIVSQRLKEIGLERKDICSIIKITPSDLKRLEAKRLKRAGVVKRTFEHLDVEEGLSKEEQKMFTGHSQLTLVNQLIEIIENGWLDIENPKLMKAVKDLTKILHRL